MHALLQFFRVRRVMDNALKEDVRGMLQREFGINESSDFMNRIKKCMHNLNRHACFVTIFQSPSIYGGCVDS